MEISPRSLTAVIQLKFDYQEREAKPVGCCDVEMISQILDKACGLDPELQELLLKCADLLNQVKPK